MSTIKVTRKSKHEALIASLSLCPAVAALPLVCTKEQKAWWNTYIGKPFRECVGPRGKKTDNARTWTRDLFIGEFCDTNYNHLTEPERVQYELIIGDTIYQYLTNHTSRGGVGVQPKQAPIKQRTYGHDYWARDNPEQFNTMLEEHKEAHPTFELNVGSRRSITSTFFQRLPQGEQDKYRKLASEDLQVIKSLGQLTGNAKDHYIEKFPKMFKTFLKDAEACGGIKINAQVLSETPDGSYRINTFLSEGLKSFRNAPALAQTMHAMKNWVEETVGKQVGGDTPFPTVYPDNTQDGYPLLPEDWMGMKLNDLQKLFRVFVTMVWVFQGGVGKVPWGEIEGNPQKWIEPDRMPADVEFKDPNDLVTKAVVTWLEFFRESQAGANHSRRFQFRQIIAGLSPIDSSMSLETSRKIVKRLEKDVWALAFDETVTKCHAPGGMRYPAASLEYARFLAGHDPQARCAFNPPAEWEGLPARAPHHPSSIIAGEEKEMVLRLASQLPEAERAIPLNLVESLNQHQLHVPVSTIEGLWSDKNQLPTVLPLAYPALTPDYNFFDGFWLDKAYFQPPGRVPSESTIPFYESWQESILQSGPLHHAQSGTLLGGYTGTVWIVRSLLMLVFNFSAARGTLEPPVALPAGCDITRLPVGEWERLRGWCLAWINALRSSTVVLSKTFEERCSALPNLNPEPEELASRGSLQNGTGDHSKRHDRRTGRRHGAKALPNGAGFEEEGFLDEEDESEDDLVDYEALDKVASEEGEDEELEEEGEAEGEYVVPPLPGLSPRIADPYEEPIGMGLDKDEELIVVTCSPTSPSNDLKGKSPEILRPASQGTSRPSHHAVCSPCEHVFGDFLPLPKLPKRTPINLYEGIVAGMQRVENNIQATLQEWTNLSELHPRLRIEDHNAARAIAVDFPEQWRPLLEHLSLRRIAWRRAEKVAPAVFNYALHTMLHARDYAYLTACSAKFCGAVEMTGNPRGYNLEALRRIQSRLAIGATELRCHYGEFKSFEGRTRNNLLINWADEAEAMRNRHLEERKRLWKATGQPWKESMAWFWYRFGNAVRGEEPHGLRACVSNALTHSQPYSASLSVIDTVRHPSGSSHAVSLQLTTEEEKRLASQYFQFPAQNHIDENQGVHGPNDNLALEPTLTLPPVVADVALASSTTASSSSPALEALLATPDVLYNPGIDLPVLPVISAQPGLPVPLVSTGLPVPTVPHVSTAPPVSPVVVSTGLPVSTVPPVSPVVATMPVMSTMMLLSTTPVTPSMAVNPAILVAPAAPSVSDAPAVPVASPTTATEDPTSERLANGTSAGPIEAIGEPNVPAETHEPLKKKSRKRAADSEGQATEGSIAKNRPRRNASGRVSIRR